MPDTCCERDADTVEFFPQRISFPRVTTDNYLRQAATNIAHILRQPQKTIPTLTYGMPVTNAYIYLEQILKRATEQNKLVKENVTIEHSPRVQQNKVSTVPALRVMQKVLPGPITPPRVQMQHPLVQQRLERQHKLRPH